MKYFKLTDKELFELLKDQQQLYALQAYGVDNWDGYEEAINDEEFEVTPEDFEKYEELYEVEE